MSTTFSDSSTIHLIKDLTFDKTFDVTQYSTGSRNWFPMFMSDHVIGKLTEVGSVDLIDKMGHVKAIHVINDVKSEFCL